MSRVHNSEPYSRQHEHLWTLMDPDLYMHQMDIFVYFCLCFSLLFSSQRHYDIPTSSTLHDGLLSSPQHHVWQQSPMSPILLHILLLFVRTFPLSLLVEIEYILHYNMYQFGSYIPSANNSLSLETGSTAAYQAFHLYCQWLPSLTTKSIYYYLYLLYFCTSLMSLSFEEHCL